MTIIPITMKELTCAHLPHHLRKMGTGGNHHRCAMQFELLKQISNFLSLSIHLRWHLHRVLDRWPQVELIQYFGWQSETFGFECQMSCLEEVQSQSFGSQPSLSLWLSLALSGSLSQALSLSARFSRSLSRCQPVALSLSPHPVFLSLLSSQLLNRGCHDTEESLCNINNVRCACTVPRPGYYSYRG